MRSVIQPLRLLLCRTLIVLGLFGSFQSIAQAGVKVDFDAATLNNLLGALTHQELDVPITDSRSIKVRLDNLRLKGFDPTAGEERQGFLLTALELSAPELGLSVSVEPRLSLAVVEVGTRSVLELRFEEVSLPLPLGSLNLAPFLPPIRFPADQIFLMDGAAGEVQVRSKLSRVRIGRDVLQFEFDVRVQP